MGAAVLSLSEALRRLASPDAALRYSPLTGEPLLVVDLRETPGVVDPPGLRTLATLPCPSVALVRAQGASADWLAHFDVCVESEGSLEAVRAGVEGSPLASAALVQLLRQSAGLAVPDALVAESFVYSTLQAGPEFAAWLEHRDPPGPPQPDPRPPVRVERRNATLLITLDRPHKRNAYSAAMRDGLCEALELGLCDESLGRVELRGAGAAFSSGGDLAEFGTFPDPATAHAVRTTRSAGRLLHQLRGRVHAFVHGACVGAGVELPAFTGSVVAAEDAFFALPEVAMGLCPGAGGTVSLPRRIGRQRTAWLALTGERIDARSAHAWGLVDEVLAHLPPSPG